MPTFSTDFIPPDPITGLILEEDLPASAIHLSWDATSIAQIDFAGYRVYRSLNGGASFSLLSVLLNTTDVAYDDYEVPLNVTVIYRVTQSNLDFESDPAEASGSLEDPRWWVVRPGDLTLTFAIEKVRGAPITSPKVMEVYSPMGRPGKLAVSDVVQAEDGELTFLVMPDNLGMITLLKAIQAQMEGGIVLKAPDGSIFEVQFGSMSRAFTVVPGMQEVTLPFVGVS